MTFWPNINVVFCIFLFDVMIKPLYYSKMKVHLLLGIGSQSQYALLHESMSSGQKKSKCGSSLKSKSNRCKIMYFCQTMEMNNKQHNIHDYATIKPCQDPKVDHWASVWETLLFWKIKSKSKSRYDQVISIVFFLFFFFNKSLSKIKISHFWDIIQ